MSKVYDNRIIYEKLMAVDLSDEQVNDAMNSYKIDASTTEPWQRLKCELSLSERKEKQEVG